MLLVFIFILEVHIEHWLCDIFLTLCHWTYTLYFHILGVSLPWGSKGKTGSHGRSSRDTQHSGRWRGRCGQIWAILVVSPPRSWSHSAGRWERRLLWDISFWVQGRWRVQGIRCACTQGPACEATDLVFVIIHSELERYHEIKQNVLPGPQGVFV